VLHGGSTGEDMTTDGKSVLVAGIYLAGQENNIEHIVESLGGRTGGWRAVQRWTAIGGGDVSEEVRRVTVENLQRGTPKFILLNRMLEREPLGEYDFVIVCDDDISLPDGFLPDYLDLVVKYDFALAQPARTHNSYIDHRIVEQLDGLAARRTRFVEIGPLFSVRKDIYPAIFPFDESAYMGWGYDFVWPCVIEKMGLRMGIVDATPVDHSMRKPVHNYNYDDADRSQADYMSRHPHLSTYEAFRILESYA
jgi:hypothetical protein